MNNEQQSESTPLNTVASPTDEAQQAEAVQPNDEIYLAMDSLSKLPVLKGASGNTYRAVNFMTELTPRHKNDLRDALDPVIPTLLHIVTAGLKVFEEAKEEITGDMIMSLLREAKLSHLIQAVYMEELDVRFAAMMFLPESDRKWKPEDVETRMEDFRDIPSAVMIEAIRHFFSSSFTLSPGTFLVWIMGILRSRNRNQTVLMSSLQHQN